MKNYGTNNFTGGMNNSISARLLEANTAQLIENGEVSTGSLKSVRGLANTEFSSPVELDHYGNSSRSVVKWYKRWYWSDNEAVNEPFYGGSDFAPGITPPEAPPQVTATKIAPSGTAESVTIATGAATGTTGYIELSPESGTSDELDTLTISGGTEVVLVSDGNTIILKNGSGNLALGADIDLTSDKSVKLTRASDSDDWEQEAQGLTGSFKYCWTYSNEDSFESAPGEGNSWYEGITLEDHKAAYTLPSEWPDNVETIIIYRTANEGSVFYYINEHTSDDAGKTFYDLDTDLDITFRESNDTINYLPPPDGGKFLTESDGVFWLAVGDRLYFSPAGNPHAWPPLNWIGIDDTITGIVREFSGILVFTNNKPYRVTGTDADTIAKTEIPGTQGCPNWRTIAMISNAPVWHSNDGICVWDGSNVNLLSYGKYDINFTPVHAVSANDVYYLFHENGCVCFDRRAGNTFRELDISCEYAWYDANADALYLMDSEGVIYLFGVGDRLEVTYLSPQICDNTIPLKQFRRIFIHSDCEVSAVFRLDGETKKTLSIKGRGKRTEYLPSSCYGRYAEIELSFTGTLNEYGVEYSEEMN